MEQRFLHGALPWPSVRGVAEDGDQKPNERKPSERRTAAGPPGLEAEMRVGGGLNEDA
jgi:hypothetical protein